MSSRDARRRARRQGQWERLKGIVDSDLASVLGWSSKEEALEIEDLGRLGDFCDRLAVVATNLQTGHEALIRRSLEGLSSSKMTGSRQLNA